MNSIHSSTAPFISGGWVSRNNTLQQVYVLTVIDINHNVLPSKNPLLQDPDLKIVRSALVDLWCQAKMQESNPEVDIGQDSDLNIVCIAGGPVPKMQKLFRLSGYWSTCEQHLWPVQLGLVGLVGANLGQFL